MVFRSVPIHSRTLPGRRSLTAFTVFAAVLATGIFTSSSAQNGKARKKADSVPSLVQRIEAVLHNELEYVDPPAFPAVRDAVVRKDKQRLVEAFENHIAAPVGADFAKQSTTGQAMRLLRVLSGIPRLGINEFIDEEIVLVDESRKQLTDLLERLRHRVRERLETLRGPSQLVVAGELVLSRVTGPQTGEFYATLDPCTHGTVLNLLGKERAAGADANSAEAPAEMMNRPLTSVNYIEAQRLAGKLSEGAGIALRLPTAGQARAMNINKLAVWTQTPWAEHTGDDTEQIRYGVEMRTVADVGGVMGERDFFSHVPFARHPRLGIVFVSSVSEVRNRWMKQLQERVKP